MRARALWQGRVFKDPGLGGREAAVQGGRGRTGNGGLGPGQWEACGFARTGRGVQWRRGPAAAGRRLPWLLGREQTGNVGLREARWAWASRGALGTRGTHDLRLILEGGRAGPGDRGGVGGGGQGHRCLWLEPMGRGVP